ncbi:MAG: PDZ domain-containing protein [Chloroflexaceae bacterium]|nr:PDZ domain-containing protein [Chloroflexaceae bacterium]
MKRYLFWIPTLLTTLALLGGCGALLISGPMLAAGVARAGQATPTPAPAAPATSSAPGNPLLALETMLHDIATHVSPSVVNIQVTQKPQATSQTLPDLPDLPNLPNMPHFHFSIPPQQEPQSLPSQALGSGFVWDTQGHIVTNNHVVQGADRITVTFADGTTEDATLVGTDPDSDLAVVQVNHLPNDLQPIQVADSNQVQVGDLAVAIGNPFGLEGTLTVGFISALGRSLPVESSQLQGGTYTIPDIIQTDASINPGNSGGVLVNDAGQLIGVPTAIQSPVRASAGIGLAVPSAMVQRVVPALIEHGSYAHSWLGISGTTMTPDLAKAMQLDADQRGALVLDVTDGGPADQAGVHGSDREITMDGQPSHVGGDVLVAIDNQPINEFDDLVTYLARSTQVGQTVTLTVLRDGKPQTIDATLAARPTAR